MKCPECGGIGLTDLHTPNVGRCIKCNGSGKIEPTNEEDIRQCSTEEMAKFIQKITDRCFACGVRHADGTSNEPCKERFCSSLVFEWLKAKREEVH